MLPTILGGAAMYIAYFGLVERLSASFIFASIADFDGDVVF